ncbi:MAG TPA: ATP-binding protein [Rhodoglobus sp.]|nr:ATP-binding protein [Rhodoglobus sp.]
MARSNQQSSGLELDFESMLKSAIGKSQTLAEVITGDEVEFHDSPKMVLPRDMTFRKAQTVLQRLHDEAETETVFQRTFRYRPNDGAYAAWTCMKARWGMATAAGMPGFFGMQPAETRTIGIGVGKTMQVPWGLVQIPSMEGLEFYVTETNDDEYGKVSLLYAKGPKKYKSQVESLFDDVEAFLATNSIYRGHALIGSSKLDFLDTSLDLSSIVFSTDVLELLEGTIWGPIRYSDAMRREGVPLKRSILLHGPFGTGKSSAGLLTAQVAAQHGWTFISAKPGRDKVEDVLRTARLYEPAVVFVEDLDSQANTNEADAVSRLLDAFDGITSKGGELIMVLTTNHLDRIHKGMLRPGRLDAMVEIAGLDRASIEKLIKAVVPKNRLADTVDYDAVYASMDGFLPAFVREAITRAVSFAVTRAQGQGSYVIDTPDLVHASRSLLPQLEALNDAGEGKPKPTLDRAFNELVENALGEVRVFDGHYDQFHQVKVGADENEK